jgi:hypothetical protein
LLLKSGLVADGGFEVMTLLGTPMQVASCASPGNDELPPEEELDIHPLGMSERTSSALRAVLRALLPGLDAAPAVPVNRLNASPTARAAAGTLRATAPHRLVGHFAICSFPDT